MLTKQRMLEIIDYIDGKLSYEDVKNFTSSLNNDDRDFLTIFRKSFGDRKKYEPRYELENFCYELSLDKVIDDRTKIIDKILNQI